jgi:hypothetical protein
VNKRLKALMAAIGLTPVANAAEAAYQGSHKYWNWKGNQAYTKFENGETRLAVVFLEDVYCYEADFVYTRSALAFPSQTRVQAYILSNSDLI